MEFDSYARVVAHTGEQPQELQRLIDRLSLGGGTNIGAAITLGLHPGRATR